MDLLLEDGGKCLNTIQNRIEQHIQSISKFTSTPQNGVTRFTYSYEDLQARNYIKEKMKEVGLTVREDGLGNIFGKLEGTLKNAPSVMIGSHFDSVPSGGAYDGIAGIVVGIEVAALYKKFNLVPKYPIEIVALVEEEGSRFGGGFMGSSGIVGLLSEEEFIHLTDRDGISTKEAMTRIGLDPSLPKKRDPKTIKAFLEMHIEQGPLLEEQRISVGVVEGIVGMAQLEVTITGRAGHAGTTPMDQRSDSLVSAANIIVKLPELVNKVSKGSVITIGRLHVFPNGANVIPEKTVFSVDIRSPKEECLQSLIYKVKELVQLPRGSRGVHTEVDQILYIKPKVMNKEIVSLLKKKSNKLGISFCPIYSGAGHDAMIFSDYTETGMIFIPSKEGRSHCPEEWSDSLHLANTVQILYEVVKELTEVS